MSDAAGAGVGVQYGLPRRGLPAAGSLRRWVAGALADLGEQGELCIRIVDEAEGRALNRDWRGRDYATNVLSFPADAMSEGMRWLGDLVLCAPVVAREAATQGKPLNHHYAHLTLHGLLHLLGHDHEDDAAAAAMEALEVRLLARLGIADPYAVDRTSSQLSQ